MVLCRWWVVIKQDCLMKLNRKCCFYFLFLKWLLFFFGEVIGVWIGMFIIFIEVFCYNEKQFYIMFIWVCVILYGLVSRCDERFMKVLVMLSLLFGVLMLFLVFFLMNWVIRCEVCWVILVQVLVILVGLGIFKFCFLVCCDILKFFLLVCGRLMG